MYLVFSSWAAACTWQLKHIHVVILILNWRMLFITFSIVKSETWLNSKAMSVSNIAKADLDWLLNWKSDLKLTKQSYIKLPWFIHNLIANAYKPRFRTTIEVPLTDKPNLNENGICWTFSPGHPHITWIIKQTALLLHCLQAIRLLSPRQELARGEALEDFGRLYVTVGRGCMQMNGAHWTTCSFSAGVWGVCEQNYWNCRKSYIKYTYIIDIREY